MYRKLCEKNGKVKIFTGDRIKGISDYKKINLKEVTRWVVERIIKDHINYEDDWILQCFLFFQAILFCFLRLVWIYLGVSLSLSKFWRQRIGMAGTRLFVMISSWMQRNSEAVVTRKRPHPLSRDEYFFDYKLFIVFYSGIYRFSLNTQAIFLRFWY